VLVQVRGKARESRLASVPNKCNSLAISNYRAIAQTSYFRRILERLLLAHYSRQVKTFQEALQFAYHPGVGV